MRPSSSEAPWSCKMPHLTLLFFYFCSKLCKWLWDFKGSRWGGGPSWAGSGGGVIALSSLSPGGWGTCVGGFQERGHGHTNTKVTARRRSGEAGRRIALYEWGQVVIPLRLEPGGRLEAIMSLSTLWRRCDLHSGLEEVPRAGPGPRAGPDCPGHQQNPPCTCSAAASPFARLGLGGHV